MAARSRDQPKFPGSGAQLLIVFNKSTKFEGSTYNGFLVLPRQRNGGKRKKKKKKKKKSNKTNRGPSPQGLGPLNIITTKVSIMGLYYFLMI